MTTEQATYRYLKVFIPSMLVYAAGSMAITWAAKNITMTPVVLYAMALIPIFGVLCTFWAHWRFAVEIDEFLRLIQIKATLLGTACVMLVASSWGTFEMLAEAPRLHIFWLLPIFWVTQSAATAFLSKKEGVF